VTEEILSRKFIKAVVALKRAQSGGIFEYQIGQIIVFGESDTVRGLADGTRTCRPFRIGSHNQQAHSTRLANNVAVDAQTVLVDAVGSDGFYTHGTHGNLTQLGKIFWHFCVCHYVK